MKRILSIVLLISAFSISARDISSYEAASIASSFLGHQSHQVLPSGDSRPVKLAKKLSAGGHTTPIYAFTDGAEYVLVSGSTDSRAQILGYGDGNFDYNNMPEAMKWWLDEYTAQMSVAGNATETTAIPRVISGDNNPAEVAPLLGDLAWNQTEPFNLLCPEINGKRTVTGCVATSTAQVMRFYNYPATGEGSWSYTANGITLSADFADSTYDWEQMPLRYTSSSTETQNMAVAKLMKDVGIAVSMKYGTSESGAMTISTIPALTENFGYDKGTRIQERSFFGLLLWEETLRNELAAGRPVIYSGQSAEGGHQFVCDGYNADGYFHFNWGWGGMCNGYFLTSALVPESAGAGGFIDGYNFNQSIITGIQPAVDSHDTSWGETLLGQTYDSADGYNYNIRVAGINFQKGTANIEFGLMAADSDMPLIEASRIVSLQTVSSATHVSARGSGAMSATTLINNTLYCDPVEQFNLADGIYYVFPVARPAGSDRWEIVPMGATQTVCIQVDGGEVSVVEPGQGQLTLDAIEFPQSLTIGTTTDIDGIISVRNDEFNNTLGLIIRSEAGDTLGMAATQLLDIPANSSIDFNLPVVIPPITAAGKGYAQLMISGRAFGQPIQVNLASNAVALTPDNFPDAAILAILKNRDTDGDGTLSDLEISHISQIIARNKDIIDLTGLNRLVALRELYLDGNKINDIDLQPFRNLELLSIDNNHLTHLDVSHNTKLMYLHCAANDISHIDVTPLTMLRDLDVSDNPILALDLTPVESLSSFKADSEATIPVDSNGDYDMSAIEGFDPDNVTDLQGATLDGNILHSTAREVRYNYNTGNTVVGALPVCLAVTGTTAVDSINDNAVDVYVSGHTIVNPNGITVQVYSINGTSVYNGNDSQIQLTHPGVYLLAAHDTTTKVVIR